MNNKYFVYILRSKKDGRRYIGFTENLRKRLLDHQAGLVKSTKHRRPLELIHFEIFTEKKEAQEREKFFKTGQGRQHLIDLGI